MGPLLETSFCFTLRCLIVGASWSWLLYPITRRTESLLLRHLTAGTLTLLTGLFLNTAAALVLGQFGLYLFPFPEFLVLAGITAAGAAAGLKRDLSALKGQFTSSLSSAVLYAAVFAALSSAQPSGEWIVGGWDPGIYISEGITLEKEGTFYPRDTFFAEELTDDEQRLFTRRIGGRVERFPGVVVDGYRKAFTFQFFRLTPSLVAVLHRCGGIPGALTVNIALGVLVLAAFFVMVLQHSSKSHALFSLAFLALQPLWVYHLHVPVSEMLHLLVIISLGLILPYRRRGRWGPVVFGGLLMMMVLNRFSSLPFTGMILLFTAAADSTRVERRRVAAERIWQIGGILAGMAADMLIAPVSLVGWNVYPVLLKAFGLFTAAALIVDVLSLKEKFRRIASSPPLWARRTVPLVLLLAGVALYLVGKYLPFTAETDNLYRLVSFLGGLPVAAAVVGGLLLFLRGTGTREFRAFLLFLLGVTAVLLVKKWAPDIYPWATRRHLAYTVPAVAILAGYPLFLLWDARRRRGPLYGAAALVLLVLLVAPGVPKSWRALSQAEHIGASQLLARLAPIVGEEDIVLADTPRWGTPLALIYGKNVLDGKPFWRWKDRKQMRNGLAVLERLRREGHTIRFLTSTPREGLDIYPLPLEPVSLDWESEEVRLKEIIHSPTASDFEVRHRPVILRLYTWKP